MRINIDYIARRLCYATEAISVRMHRYCTDEMIEEINARVHSVWHELDALGVSTRLDNGCVRIGYTVDIVANGYEAVDRAVYALVERAEAEGWLISSVFDFLEV